MSDGMLPPALPAHEPSLVVRALVFFGARACNDGDRCLPPPPGIPPLDWQWCWYSLHASNAPAALLVVAVAVTLVRVLGALWAEVGTDTAMGRTRLLIAGICLASAGIGTGLSLESALRSYGNVAENLHSALDRFGHAENVLVYMDNASARLAKEVSLLTGVCPGLHELLQRSEGPGGWSKVEVLQANLHQELKEYRNMVKNARADTQGIAPLLEGIGARLHGWPIFLICCIKLPAKLLGLGGFLMLFLVVVQRYSGSQGGALHPILRGLGFALLATFTFAVASGATSVLGLMVISGSFCLDPGVASMGLMQSNLHGIMELNITRSYFLDAIEGGRLAPAEVTLTAARRRMDSASAALAGTQREIDMLGLICNPIARMDIKSTLGQLGNSTDKALQLLSAETVHQRFIEVVHQSVCGTALESLACLASFEMLIALICLPLLAAPMLVFLRGNLVQQPEGAKSVPTDYERLCPYTETSGKSGIAAVGVGHGASPGAALSVSSPFIPRHISAPTGIRQVRSVAHGADAVLPPSLEPGSHGGSLVMHSAPAVLYSSEPTVHFTPAKAPGLSTLLTERRVRFRDESGDALSSQLSPMGSFQSNVSVQMVGQR